MDIVERPVGTAVLGELIEALRGHRAEIVGADEWRPAAEHMMYLLDGARFMGRCEGMEQAAKIAGGADHFDAPGAAVAIAIRAALGHSGTK